MTLRSSESTSTVSARSEVSSRLIFLSLVPPTILVAETVVGGYQGQTITLECGVEAWPRAVNYWEKDGRVLAAGAKYEISEEEQGTVQYKFM